MAATGPFDVIVAGELIEHVGSIDMLFEVARDLLSPTGEMILTTPNPWAPARVAAGQRGEVWENADHILFAFPSGVAELAERHGLGARRGCDHDVAGLAAAKCEGGAEDRAGARCGARSGSTWALPPRGPLES